MLDRSTTADPTDAPLRLLVADDHHLFAHGIARLLETEPWIEVTSVAACGRTALSLVAKDRPEMVLLDISMPDMDGIACTEGICCQFPGVKVILLTVHDDDECVARGLEAGARGYVLKDATKAELLHALRVVRSGGRFVSPRLAGGLERGRRAEPLADSGDRVPLTAREVEILRLVAAGESTKAIAYRLGISGKTVRNHVSNIYQKLDLRERAELTLYAVRNGLIRP